MSDEVKQRKPKSIINALRVLNELRIEKGLPKATKLTEKKRVSKEEKLEITVAVIKELYPNALTNQVYHLSDDQAKRIVNEVERRIQKLTR